MGWITDWARRLAAWWRGTPPARPLPNADREAIDRVRSRLLRQLDEDGRTRRATPVHDRRAWPRRIR